MFVWSALAYIAVSILAAIANPLWVARSDLGSASGCFRDDALLVFVRCRGFAGADLAGGLLSLPWTQGQVLYFSITGLTGILQEPLFELLLIVSALFLWSPVVFLLWLFGGAARNA
jgi:hypothetical protein